MITDTRIHLNSMIDVKSKNILLIFPNQRLKFRYKMYCNPKENEILVNVHNLFKQIVGLRFKEYKYIGYNEIEERLKDGKYD